MAHEARRGLAVRGNQRAEEFRIAPAAALSRDFRATFPRDQREDSGMRRRQRHSLLAVNASGVPTAGSPVANGEHGMRRHHHRDDDAIGFIE